MAETGYHTTIRIGPKSVRPTETDRPGLEPDRTDDYWRPGRTGPVGPRAIHGPDRTNFRSRFGSVQSRSVSVGPGSVWTEVGHLWLRNSHRIRSAVSSA